MKAKKNRHRQRAEFCPEHFRNPPALFRPGYFWLLNDTLALPVLCRQLRDMRSAGAGTVCPHPMPAEFRPDTMATRMHPGYLGREYFRLYRNIVAECRKLGMFCWLYDEGGWPSGGACGRVYAESPQRFACKRLEAERKHLDAGQSAAVPPDALCAVLEDCAGRRRVFAPAENAAAAGSGAVLWIFYVRLSPRCYDFEAKNRNAPYVDILCRDAVRAFMRLTHEQYARAVGGEFGRRIKFVFTDEPAVCYTAPGRNLTWTDDMLREFKRRKGYALEPVLPDIFSVPSENERPEATRARIDFYDVWSNLLVERFLAPQRQWCEERGLLFGGHFGGENEPAGNAHYGFGHVLRALRGLSLPGVDTIWRQIFPGRDSAPYPLYAASAAAQKGSALVATESFAVYGAGLTPAQMKWITDFQYVRGVTLMVLSNYPYSTKGHFMRFCRPQFGPHNPLWKYIDLFHEHAGRLGYLLSRGSSGCGTALYHDVRSIWAGVRFAAEAIAQHEELCRRLLAGQREFEFVDDDILAGGGKGGVLRAGAAGYALAIVPATRWMAPEALRGLVEFAAGGGTVVAAGAAPAADGGRITFEALAGLPPLAMPAEARVGKGKLIVCPAAEAAAVPAPLFEVEPVQPTLRARRRVLRRGSLYFIFNEEEKHLSFEARFNESGRPVLCDLDKGVFYAVPFRRRGGAVSIHVDMLPWGSAVVAFGLEPDRPVETFKFSHVFPLKRGWKLAPVRAVRAGDEDFIEENFQAEPVPAALGDWRAALGQYFSGEARYSIEFKYPAEFAGRRVRLDMGEVRYACEVFLNGAPVGRRTWPPFTVELGGALSPGLNRLEIQVANTLANAMAEPGNMERHSSFTASDGTRRELAYEKTVRPFEAESLASGLFGPVQILVE